ncbi:hypothetical protein PAPHI01_1898 [Pancytospora philotis]|nr:hypothetical protein PAPHI01_1898 [Pancytospora philotis]
MRITAGFLLGLTAARRISDESSATLASDQQAAEPAVYTRRGNESDSSDNGSDEFRDVVVMPDSRNNEVPNFKRAKEEPKKQKSTAADAEFGADEKPEKSEDAAKGDGDKAESDEPSSKNKSALLTTSDAGQYANLLVSSLLPSNGASSRASSGKDSNSFKNPAPKGSERYSEDDKDLNSSNASRAKSKATRSALSYSKPNRSGMRTASSSRTKASSKSFMNSTAARHSSAFLSDKKAGTAESPSSESDYQLDGSTKNKHGGNAHKRKSASKDTAPEASDDTLDEQADED